MHFIHRFLTKMIRSQLLSSLYQASLRTDYTILTPKILIITQF